MRAFFASKRTCICGAHPAAPIEHALNRGRANRVTKDGAIAYVCMDWRHMRKMLDAGEQAFTELKNVCLWNKTNGGMGSFYRSKHAFVVVFKIGTAAHTNSF